MYTEQEMEKQLTEQLTLQKVAEELSEVKKAIYYRDVCPEIRKQWIPKHELMRFLDFADTQMAAITKSHPFVTTTIGKKKFYHADSILKVLQENQHETFVNPIDYLRNKKGDKL